MTLAQAPLLTNGASHSAQSFRMMIRDLCRGSEGITEGDDLQVAPLTVPAGAVQIGDGSGVIRGRAAPWQGHYTAYNIGSSQVPIAPTGAAPRSDLVCLRVQDPEYEGNRNPATDPVVFFDVIPGVPGGTRSVPPGYSAIALARVDLPANTGTVTAAMINDLRRIANPRRQRYLNTAFPDHDSWQNPTDTNWHNWPNEARWNLAVPPWARNVKIVTTIAGFRMARANVIGSMQHAFGATNPIEGNDTDIDDDQGTGGRRVTVVIADDFGIRPAMRGTTQPLYLQTMLRRTYSGDVGVDGSTSIVCDVEFNEDY
ncbi:hypothetical protein [Streptomyces sp. NPDC001404]|uniref:hypothetical protein n=1 Tax=Streptomyces sp. NPDC001404 TaxID=3364571 RepID=UPI0036B511F5